MGLESSLSPKNEVSKVLAKMLSTQIYMLFCFNKKVPKVFSLFARTTCLEKIGFLSYGPKTSRPIRMQDSLN